MSGFFGLQSYIQAIASVLHINSAYDVPLKALDTALQGVPKDRNGKLSKEYLRVALDVLAPSSDLPPLGAVDQVVWAKN